ncbi:MAG: HipA domain-containing protein [Verrucomicrobiales bacterium]
MLTPNQNSLPPGIPVDRCLSTLQPTAGGKSYSARAIRELWNGHRVRPLLDFRKEDFLTIQRETAGRISISGVQDKISLRLEGNRLVPTEKRGDYLLKPVPLATYPKFTPDIPANEHLTMQIAAQVFGIPAAANGLVFFQGGEPAYITRRFDRDTANQPLAQEDFCQLSNRSPDTAGPNYKYDASYEEAGEILRRFCPSYRIEIEKLFRLIAFNYVFANGDAHLKNFSLLETPLGDFALAPAYDLLMTSLHLPNESRTALDLFADDFETASYEVNGFYKRPDFLEVAKRFGIAAQRVVRMLDAFAKQSAKVGDMVERSLLSSEAKTAYLALYQDRLRAIAD